MPKILLAIEFFKNPFAQPVIPINYSKLFRLSKRPLKMFTLQILNKFILGTEALTMRLSLAKES